MSYQHKLELFEPDMKDLDSTVRRLSDSFGTLFMEMWEQRKKYYNDKPLELHIAAYMNLLCNGAIKLFILYDQSKTPVGFLSAIMFRPLPYNATVFQIQFVYARGGVEVEQKIINEVLDSVKILGCDEIWMDYYEDHPLHCGITWRPASDITVRRFHKGSLV